MAIGNELVNELSHARHARTFSRRVVGWWFADWPALEQENRRIWSTYYRSKPLYDPWPTWEAWLPEYTQLVIEVQDIWECATCAGWASCASKK